ncbi:HdeD family acid-resistance protein [Staphylococcus simulans]|uniref:HdeD family acid-resistance protein n=1 Tax=Staphylococcus simulans TaxID=1286 RepID=UPI00399A6EA8
MSTNHIRWSSLVIGLLFAIIGILSVSFPVENLTVITWLFGIFFIINGIGELFFRRLTKAFVGISSGWLMLTGILDIIFGILLIVFTDAGQAAIVYMLAFWFIFASILGIFTVTPVERTNKAYHFFSILVNIIGIIAGIILLFNPLIGAFLIAFFVGVTFLLIGLNYIFDAFAH